VTPVGRPTSRPGRAWPAPFAGAILVAAAAVGGLGGFLVGPREGAAPIVQANEIIDLSRAEPLASAAAISVTPVSLPHLEAQPITAAERKAGFGECYAPDPLGLGPYAPYRKVAGARVAVPQRGGHTEDLGYDVVLHFHGGDPARKTLVQVAGGVVFAAVDKGVGSGPYQQAFVRREAWTRLRAGIASVLRAHAGDERAHIRHLALSAWSAGYGAVNEILATNGSDGIDAVILLDGLHAGRNPRWPGPDDGSLGALDRGTVSAVFDYAAAAARGEKLMVLTHTNVVPTGYASVKRTADLLLAELGLGRHAWRRPLGLAQQLTAADEAGLHVWGFAGRYEEAHCAQVSLLGEIVRDVLEPAWGTPAMDRAVPPTPPPGLGAGESARRAEARPGPP